MYVRLLLSLGLLACLVAADTATTPKQSTNELASRADVYDGIFKDKDNQARKLLEAGAPVNVFFQPHLIIYIGGKDGIYVYDDSTEKLEKYGTVDDSIIDIAKSNNTDTVYIITEDNSVYKVTEGGTKKTKVEGADGAKRISLDWVDNLYFIGADNFAYVVTADGIKKIQGLPTDQRNAIFYKAHPDTGHGLNLAWDGFVYFVFSDGTSRPNGLSAEEKAIIAEDARKTQKKLEDIENGKN